jgi:hypothetical protein
VKRKLQDKISEGASVSVDGYRYTLYNVIDENDAQFLNTGTERLNGGGIKWNDARIECKRRGKELAMIMSNDAAIAIADIMLKNRPCMSLPEIFSFDNTARLSHFNLQLVGKQLIFH